ncbi:hypothetical protein B0I27_101250 [Arcticibacter pallidicorallinus]|uniref:Lipoprotein n=1 Tax=Arcticibacter pallidicorallinus TaxID=1259464 RepID=A0A2T0UBG0_9SPHI|nr:hypothetical protein [Arcticibacter pallidicorallinus]PRY55281.1 hypothetical protein B0I27_101250 [Arcticibacter pallidicorallinus]
MKKVFCVFSGFLILFFGGGCSLLRKEVVSRQDSVRTDSRKASLDWKVDSVDWASRVFTYSDSSGAEFEVEIVPLGPFSFSAKGGFAGSASVLRLRGKTQSTIRSADSSSRQQHVQSTGSQKEDTKARTEKLQKETVKKNDKSLWWVIALLSIGSLVLFFIYMRKI